MGLAGFDSRLRTPGNGKTGNNKPKGNEVPNHCQNFTDVAGPTSDLRLLIEKLYNEDGEVLLSNLMPRPENEPSNWYKWECANWGTKWGDYDHFVDAYDLFEEDEDKDTISFGYHTAWGPFSAGFWEKVSAMFPTLTFSTTYEESGCCFAGAVLAKNGVVFEKYTENLPDFPSGDGDQYVEAFDKWNDEMAVLRDQMADWCAEQMANHDSAEVTA